MCRMVMWPMASPDLKRSLSLRQQFKALIFFELAYTAHSFTSYRLWCTLSKCIGQTACSFEHYFVCQPSLCIRRCNRLHYGSCSSVRPSVSPSNTVYDLETEGRKKIKIGVNILPGRINRCVNFQLKRSKMRRTAAHMLALWPSSLWRLNLYVTLLWCFHM